MFGGGLGVVLLGLGGVLAQASELRGLDRQRPSVAVGELPKLGSVSAPGTGRLTERRIVPSAPGAEATETSTASAALTHRADPAIEAEYLRAEPQLAQCRIEVARRRRVLPSRIAAEEVTLRWTIEPSGRVRDAEAVTAAHTDLEVAACAKRVISDWRFRQIPGGPVTVEWTYRFR
jgi:hypothetical protein